MGLITIIVVLSGCSFPKSNESQIHKSVFFIAWDGIIYGLSEQKISPAEIGAEIGKTKRFVSPKPEENGDAGMIYSEGPSRIPPGSKLYRIKGIGKNEAIAVKIDNDYIKANKIGLLKK